MNNQDFCGEKLQFENSKPKALTLEHVYVLEEKFGHPCGYNEGRREKKRVTVLDYLGTCLSW